VILASRSREKGVEAALKLQSEGLAVEALQLDVTSPASIAEAAREVERKHGRIDVLINNAGVLLDDLTRKPSEQSLDLWRKTYDTNVFGLVAVTQAFLPLLKRSKAGRIVNLSSILGSLTLHSEPGSPIYGFMAPAYNSSKSAVNAWTVHLAYELRDTPIKVNAAHPGHVKTDMGGEGASMEIVDGANTSVQLSLLPDNGPSGAYVHLGQPLPW
jgi:NAD(P)-dependent dehydrogenase (short-subunit alcohol dehydrogenase family)